jgi:hypothetical protein
MMKGMPLCHKLWEPSSALEWKWVVQMSSGVESKGLPMWLVAVGLIRPFSLLVSHILIGECVPNTYLTIAQIWRESLGFPPIVGLRIP